MCSSLAAAEAVMDMAAVSMQKNSKSVRKPKLSPVKVFNSHHMQYLSDKAREKELEENPPTGLSIDRPVGVKRLTTSASFAKNCVSVKWLHKSVTVVLGTSNCIYVIALCRIFFKHNKGL